VELPNLDRTGHALSVMIEAPAYVTVAYLRDGRFRCIASVLAVLHVTGNVVAGRRGAVRRSDLTTAPADGWERVIWKSLHGQVAPRTLAARRPVDEAFGDLRRELQGRRLIRPFMPARGWLPVRTHQGDRLLAEAMARSPWPPMAWSPDRSPRDAVGLPIALYGAAALRVLLPAFASAGGLLDKSSADAGLFEENPTIDRTDYFPGM